MDLERGFVLLQPIVLFIQFPTLPMASGSPPPNNPSSPSSDDIPLSDLGGGNQPESTPAPLSNGTSAIGLYPSESTSSKLALPEKLGGSASKIQSEPALPPPAEQVLVPAGDPTSTLDTEAPRPKSTEIEPELPSDKHNQQNLGASSDPKWYNTWRPFVEKNYILLSRLTYILTLFFFFLTLIQATLFPSYISCIRAGCGEGLEPSSNELSILIVGTFIFSF